MQELAVVLRLEGRSLEELLSKAPIALTGLFFAGEDVVAREIRSIEIRAADPQGLLGEWVDRLLAVLAEENVLFARADVRIEGAGGGPKALCGTLWGEPFDPHWHGRNEAVGWRRRRSALQGRRRDVVRATVILERLVADRAGT